ncbi:EAL domain-containing protein [Bacillus sp. CGMCC 1.16607]|uniref:EAL domain-containing protein n=1 Tax=Bacillus sp. CGMCC 1.16607 TaxID=3351842 RepID=UPI00362C7D1C
MKPKLSIPSAIDTSEVLCSVLKEEGYYKNYLIYYQPQVCLRTFKIVGVEVRFRKMNLYDSFISFNQFYSLLDEEEVGKRMVMKVFQQFNEILQNGVSITLSIALSAQQLQDKNLIEHIKHNTSIFEIKSSLIRFELAESIITYLEESIENIKQLKELGYRVALDDFGTGYASLSYLDYLHIDTLKLNKSYVSKIKNIETDIPVLDGIIKIASDLELEIIGEGVEDMKQLTYLKQRNCNIIQGSLFSDPLSFERFMHLLNLSNKSFIWF